MKKSLLSCLTLALIAGQPVLAIDTSRKHDYLVENNSCVDIENSTSLIPSLVSPGDNISYKILNLSDIDARDSNIQTITIDSRGAAFLPGIGTISFANVYEEELSEKLEQVYKYIMLEPVIDVIKVEKVSQVFTISGAVESPGIYSFDNSSSVNRNSTSIVGIDTSEKLSRKGSTTSFFDVIKISGGLTLNADTSNIFIYYQSKEGRICRKVNLTSAILGQEWSRYVPVANNMQIVVRTRKDKDPKNLSKIVIKKSSLFSRNKTLILFGQFISPGVYKYDQAPSLAEVLAKAGGLRFESSKSLYIIPPSKDDGSYNTEDIKIINLSKITQWSDDIEFVPGTLVYAPESRSTILQMHLSQVSTILNPLLTVYGIFLK